MPVYQSFNPRINAWVKYKFSKGLGFKALDVKQRLPRKPFKAVKIKTKKNGKNSNNWQ